MRPPSTPEGVLFAAVLALGAVTAAGAGIGYAASPPPPSNKSVGAVEGGTLGALAASFGGLLVGASSRRWRRVAETTAMVGIGGVLVMATLGAVKNTQALVQPAQLTPGVTS